MLATRQMMRSTALRRAFSSYTARCAEPSYQAPGPAKPQVNRHRQFYRTQGYPVFKAALIAITTYELLYWGWLKLESLETISEQEGVVKELQQEVKQLLKSQTG